MLSLTRCGKRLEVESPVTQPLIRPDAGIKIGPIPAGDRAVPLLRLWSIRRSIILVVAAALLLVGAMVAGAFWLADWPSLKKDASVTPATVFELLKLVFAVVAGIGGVAALVVAYRRQRVAEHTNVLAEFAHQLANAADRRAEAADERAKVETERNGVRLFNERFARASEQIGSEKAAVRLAGIYAMAGLADDWQEGRQTCIDVLCAYLRMPYVPPPVDIERGAGQGGKARARNQEIRNALEERQVRRAVVGLVREHLARPESPPMVQPWGKENLYFDEVMLDLPEPAPPMVRGRQQSWRGCNFNFDGAVFDGVDFTEMFQDAGKFSFENAKFVGGSTSFAGSIFNGYASFDRAQFSHGEVGFDGVEFNGNISFREATFKGGVVAFSNAKFSGSVRFADAVVSGGKVLFDAAIFDSGLVLFAGTKFEGGAVVFDGAWFRRSVKVDLEGALFAGGVVSLRWPLLDQGAWLDLPTIAMLPGVATEIARRDQAAI